MSALTALAAQVVNWVESEITAKWYIWYYRDSAIRGWQQIDEHLNLMKITDHGFQHDAKGVLPITVEYKDNYTIVEYKTFALKVCGRISVDEDLYSVCIWQVCVTLGVTEVHVLGTNTGHHVVPIGSTHIV